MPALRDRKSDIPELSRFFLEKYATQAGKRIPGFTPETLELMMGYDWPGNVRELENAIERGVVFASGDLFDAHDLPPTVRPSRTSAGLPVVPGASLVELERYAILETLKATGGSTSKAAKILGISARTIQYRLLEYNEAEKSHVAVVDSTRRD